MFAIILIDLSMGLGIPVTSHSLMNDEQSPLIMRITHLTWKIRTTLVEHELFEHTKQNIYLKVYSLAHTNLLGTAGRYHI